MSSTNISGDQQAQYRYHTTKSVPSFLYINSHGPEGCMHYFFLDSDTGIQSCEDKEKNCQNSSLLRFQIWCKQSVITLSTI